MSESDRAPASVRPRLLTWLLLLVLALIAWGLIDQPRPVTSGQLQTVQRMPPPVIAASGRLAQVYEDARPAVVRVEGHCAGLPGSHAPVGIGTGFFVSGDGLLLTAYHVVRSQQLGQRCDVEYRGTNLDGDAFDLELLGFDAVLDVALLQASVPDEVPFLRLAPRLPASGSGVVAIGNSRGDFLQDRAGVVLRRNVTASQVSFASGTIEMSNSLAPGDSGGPVLNEAGEVVGVVSYISYSISDNPEEGLIPRLIRGALDRPEYASYAVPVLAGSELHLNLLAGAMRDIPVIGFQLQFNYLPGASGVLLGRRPGVVVGNVQEGGPGAAAGLRSFEQRPVLDQQGRPVGSSIHADVIVALNGHSTPTFDELLAIIYEFNVGDAVVLTVQRGNDTVELELVLGARRDVFRQ